VTEVNLARSNRPSPTRTAPLTVENAASSLPPRMTMSPVAVFARSHAGLPSIVIAPSMDST
jgi:hypothetical protein